MGKNNIGLNYKYYRIVEVMQNAGHEALARGLTPKEISSELERIYPDETWGKNVRDYVKSGLSAYREGQPRFPRSRRPELFRSLGAGRWTLPDWGDAPEKQPENLLGSKAIHADTDTNPSNPVTRADMGWEGRAALKLHYRRERGKLAQKFKGQLRQFECEACNFDFGKRYGSLGRGFIEAHHAIPLNAGERVTRVDDFRAVCSNCHRMLHWKGLRRRPSITASRRPPW